MPCVPLGGISHSKTNARKRGPRPSKSNVTTPDRMRGSTRRADERVTAESLWFRLDLATAESGKSVDPTGMTVSPRYALLLS